MKIGLVCACALAAVVASGRLARADHRRIHPKLLERPTLVVSGGLASFIDPGLRDVAGVGETWSARVAVGRPKGIRVEVAYTGSAQPLAASQGTWLVGNGAVATLRVNVAPGVYPFEPAFYIGGGWMHYHARAAAESDLRSDDDVFVIPFGLALARELGRFTIDIRGGVDIAAGGELMPVPRDPDSSRTSASMHRFGLIAGVGVAL